MFSILHISDLHRSPDEPADNDSLIAALLADRDRYLKETPPIPSPDSIVVSGDLIRGAGLHQPRWEEDIKAQYQAAGEFLDQLVCRFLHGERARLIIVPGNHDVCWNTSLQSMEQVPPAEYPNDLYSALTAPRSPYRWSWGDRKLYRVRDAQIYSARMNSYWDFVEGFYAGVPVLQPLDRLRGFQLFELHDRRIVLAAFDSIDGNDCFARAGSTMPGAVGRSSMALRDLPHSYDLRVAVWHHSLGGDPSHADFMPLAPVQEMAALGFQLGLHGHQHVAATRSYYVRMAETPSMAVVSAGSLCAGHRELPRGVNRQYNLVVVGDDLRSAQVHVREMANGEQFYRKWGPENWNGFAEISWDVRRDQVGRRIDTRRSNVRQAILAAEEALSMGDPRAAVQGLSRLQQWGGSYGRKLAAKAAREQEDWPLVVEILSEPKSAEDEVFLVSALIDMNAIERATSVLSSSKDIDSATRAELAGRIDSKKRMRKS